MIRTKITGRKRSRRGNINNEEEEEDWEGNIDNENNNCNDTVCEDKNDNVIE